MPMGATFRRLPTPVTGGLSESACAALTRTDRRLRVAPHGSAPRSVESPHALRSARNNRAGPKHRDKRAGPESRRVGALLQLAAPVPDVAVLSVSRRSAGVDTLPVPGRP